MEQWQNDYETLRAFFTTRADTLLDHLDTQLAAAEAG